jgi:hypothetical protein
MSKNANLAGILISAAVFAGSCAQIISNAGTKEIAISTTSAPESTDKKCDVSINEKTGLAQADNCLSLQK